MLKSMHQQLAGIHGRIGSTGQSISDAVNLGTATAKLHQTAMMGKVTTIADQQQTIAASTAAAASAICDVDDKMEKIESGMQEVTAAVEGNSLKVVQLKDVLDRLNAKLLKKQMVGSPSEPANKKTRLTENVAASVAHLDGLF